MAITLDGTNGITTPSPLILTSSALGTATAGEFEYDGRVPYFTPAGTQRGVVPGMQYYRLNSASAGANVTTAQNVFGVGATVSSNTVYHFSAMYLLSKSAGVTSHTFNLLFGGTATYNNFVYSCQAKFNTTAFTLSQTTDNYTIYPSQATATGVVVIASAAAYLAAKIEGTMSINTGGTMIPQYSLSSAPGGAYTTAIGSYFAIWPVGAAGSNISVGTWA